MGSGGGTWDEVTRSIDLFPTLLGLSGIAMPGSSGVEGVDLSPALRGRQQAPELLAYSHTAPPTETACAEPTAIVRPPSVSALPVTLPVAVAIWPI